MNKIFYKIMLLLVVVGLSSALAQRSDPTYRRMGYHTGNRVGISFYNDGQIAGFNQGVDIRGEWPLGSGYDYIGDMTPLTGLEFFNKNNETRHSVTISRGPRKGQADKRDPLDSHFWGWNPLPGFLDVSQQSVAMSHKPASWPKGGWRDHPEYVDGSGNTVWNGYFGKGITNADQESYYWSDDQYSNKYDAEFVADTRDLTRKGMGLQMAVRGFQWASFLAENVIFWLYDFKNEGDYLYKKACFGNVVGTLAGGDGDSSDDLGYFDVNESITYSWDADGVGNKGQKVGYVGYAYLESPGNSYDGIDNDDDSGDPNGKRFTTADFDSVKYDAGQTCILINIDANNNYVRTPYTVQPGVNTVVSLGKTFVFTAGSTYFREGHIAQVQNGISIPDTTAYDGLDNDLDGLIDENQAIHLDARVLKGLPGLHYKDYIHNIGLNDPLIDEKRDNDAGTIVTTYVKGVNNTSKLVTHWSGDENANWVARDSSSGILIDDIGSDGIGPGDDAYTGPDANGTEGNGRPDQGEPNFGRTDPDESDQIGLTAFNFFNQTSSPDMSQDDVLWTRMYPGRYDVIPPTPQDGDFIYSSGYFPLAPSKTERFSLGIVYGETYSDVIRNKRIVLQIYNAGYKFPQPPRKPKINITQEDGKVVIYWDGLTTENSVDFITKSKDFEGYKIYRATDAGFIDARTITNAFGTLSFDKPIAQFDLKNSVKGFFYPSAGLLEQVGGTTFYLGDDTSGVVNRFVDSTVVPGITYYYAVCAYDKGDQTLDIFPSENSKKIFRASTGLITLDDNTAYITPGKRSIGYVPAKATALQKSAGFIGTGSAYVEVVDDKAVKPDYKYKVVFYDTSAQHLTSAYSLINTTTNDTLIKKSDVFNGQTKIVDGFRTQIYNDSKIEFDSLRSKQEGTASKINYLFQKFVVGTNVGTENPADYQIEFFSSVVGQSIGDTLIPPTSSNRFPAKDVNFKVKNLSTGQYIPFVYYKTGNLSTVHNIYFKETMNGVVKRTWRVNIYNDTANAPLPTQGTISIYTMKPFISSDSFEFSVVGGHVDNELAKNDLDKIKVVPNPYVVTHDGEQRLLSGQTSGRGERNIRFTHVPPGAKIQIFTVRGDLIKTLHQNDLYNGDVYWNLRTEENLDVAFGMYVYTIDIPGVGTKIGKLGLIK